MTDVILVETGQLCPDFSHVVWFTRAAGLHPAGCFCCVSRSPVARVLAGLYRDRTVGKVPFFARIVVFASPAGVRDVKAALIDDLLSSARFYLAEC